MAERSRLASLSDAELERELREVGRWVDHPPTPDLASAVRSRLEIESASRGRRLPPVRPLLALRRSVLLAAAALLLLVGAAVAIGLGLRGLPIFFVDRLPATATPDAAAPAGGSPGARLELGEPSTLEAAQRVARFTIRRPTLPELGEPDAVYVAPSGVGVTRVELVYRPRPGYPAAPGTEVGLLVTQFPGRTEPELVKKLAGPGTRIEPVSVQGSPGYWITGRPHALLYSGGEERYRLVGDVLIWQREDIIYRIESALGRDAVLRIAESFR